MHRYLFIILFVVSLNAGTIEVTGSGSIAYPADQFSVSCGVLTQDKGAESAIAANRQKMEKLTTLLKNVADIDLRTERFSVRPLLTPRPRDAASDWEPRLVGYEVTNRLHVTGRSIDTAGALIDLMGKGGANQIDALRFTLADPLAHRQELIESATKQALTEAKFLADAAGVSLGPIVSLQLNPRVAAVKFMRAESTSIEPGDVTLSADVLLKITIE